MISRELRVLICSKCITSDCHGQVLAGMNRGILNGDLVVSLRHFRFRSASQRYSRKRSRCFWPVSLMFKFLLTVQAMQTEVHDEKQLAILKDR